jgi:cell division transport system permease protein
MASSLAYARYFVGQTSANLRLHRLAACLTILIVAVCALIFELFALVSHNLTRIVEHGGRGVFIELYFRDEVPEPRQREMVGVLARVPQAEAVRWTSREEALDSFRAQGYGGLLEGIEGNPLPASVLLQLQPSVDLAAARDLARRLASAPEYESWSDGGEIAEKLDAAASVVRGAVWLIGLFLGLLLGFLIAGTVRVALGSRLDEIEILELVGATPAFVRLPFVLEGAVLGATGGAIAAGCVYLLYRALVASLDLGGLMLIGVGSVSFFSARMLLACCTLPTLLGAAAGLLATRRATRRARWLP